MSTFPPKGLSIVVIDESGAPVANADATLLAKSLQPYGGAPIAPARSGPRALFMKAHVSSYTTKKGTFVPEHDDKRAAATPKPAASSGYKRVKTNNEGNGFHGEASEQYFREKHGVDHDSGGLPESEHIAARKHADDKFSEVANNLVKHGVVKDHESAQKYLDSTSGRHLHDSLPRAKDGKGTASYSNAHEIPWIKKDAHRMGLAPSKPKASPVPASPYDAAQKEVLDKIHPKYHAPAKSMFGEMKAGEDEEEAASKYHFGAHTPDVHSIMDKHGINH